MGNIWFICFIAWILYSECLFVKVCSSSEERDYSKRKKNRSEKKSKWREEPLTHSSSSSSSAFHLPPRSGKGYQIYQPSLYFAKDKFVHHGKLLHSPEEWIENLIETFQHLDHITRFDDTLLSSDKQNKFLHSKDFQQRAIETYLQVLIGFLIGSSYGEAEKSVRFDSMILPFNQTLREEGQDMTYLGVTMIGRKRLNNIYLLMKDVLQQNIPGQFIETGVWRGGASIFAAAILKIYHTPKAILLCDSFNGLPPGKKQYHQGDIGWNQITYLSVADQFVAKYFEQYSLLEENIYFVKGYFNETMPVLGPAIDAIAILRLDGDMYESTVDVLYHLYEKVSIGGYVIVDDWTTFPAKDACLDFFQVHQITPTIIPITENSVYWKKEVQIVVQKWRYEKKQFKQ